MRRAGCFGIVGAMQKKRVYLDYGAATPVRDEVRAAMEPYLSEHFANPSALYQEADQTKAALEAARETIARLCGVKSEHIIFTSGSTESNNLAILGTAASHDAPGRMVSTPIEHPSVSGPLKELEEQGWEVVRVPVSSKGILNTPGVTDAVTEHTHLLTFAWANTDIGAVQPVGEIIKVLRSTNSRTLVHIDASQAGGQLSLSSVCQEADLVTLSSAKAYGPTGIAVLVVKDPHRPHPVLFGGHQETHLRPGTENVAAVVGCAKALALAEQERVGEVARIQPLRDRLIALLEELNGVVVTGPYGTERLPNHVSCAVAHMDGEELVVRLDARGFAVGTGSACTTRGTDVSVAVAALGLPPEYHRGTVRVTLGRETTEDDVTAFLAAFKDVVTEMRSFS